MSFRFPVSTQEPVHVDGPRHIRRSMVRRYVDVNGDLSVEFEVPAGQRWRIINILTDCVYGAVAQNQRVEVELDTAEPDETGNLLWFCVFGAHQANTHVFTSLSPHGYGTTSAILAVGGARYYTAYGMPDVILDEFSTIELRAYNFTATDDLVFWMSYEEII